MYWHRFEAKGAQWDVCLEGDSLVNRGCVCVCVRARSLEVRAAVLRELDDAPNFEPCLRELAQEWETACT